LALFDGQFHNFAADLGADLHLQNGLDLAVGGDNFGDIAPQDLFGLDGDDSFALVKDGADGQCRQHESQQGKDYDFPAFPGCCHLCSGVKTRLRPFCFILRQEILPPYAY